MRRVVSDQIKALKELTAVVTASGADFDVVEPTPARPSPRVEAPRKAEAPRRAPESDDDGQVMTAARRRRWRTSDPPGRARDAAPGAPSASDCRRNARRAQPVRLAVEPSRRRLARRDARHPAASAGRPANDAPEGISLDVAKFVDTEAAAEMWDRWRAGDAGAATRRLYTAAGQQSLTKSVAATAPTRSSRTR